MLLRKTIVHCVKTILTHQMPVSFMTLMMLSSNYIIFPLYFNDISVFVIPAGYITRSMRNGYHVKNLFCQVDKRGFFRGGLEGT